MIGLGQRGYSVLVSNFLKFDDVDVVAVCDLYPDRVERAVNAVKAAKRKCRP